MTPPAKDLPGYHLLSPLDLTRMTDADIVFEYGSIDRNQSER